MKLHGSLITQLPLKLKYLSRTVLESVVFYVLLNVVVFPICNVNRIELMMTNMKGN